MKYLKIGLAITLLLLLAMVSAGCDCGDDDDDDDNNDDGDDDDNDDATPGDDDDDDTTPGDDDDDDDTPGDDDDDDDDDDTSGEMVQRLVGGLPGNEGIDLIVGGNDELIVIAERARVLRQYTVTEDRAVTDEMALRFGQLPIVKQDAAGHLHVLFVDLETLSLALATNTSGVWQRVPMTLNNDTPDDKYFDLAVDAAGHHFVIYVEDDDFHPWFGTDVSGSWVNEAIDDSVAAGRNCSVDVAADGTIHAAYQDYFDDTLTYATNASGAWVAQTLDATENAGDAIRLAVDGDGFVHIVYVLFRDLYYATNASGAWERTPINDTDWVARNFDFALDAASNAHVVYFRNGETALYATNAGGSWVDEDTGVSGASEVHVAVTSSGDVVFAMAFYTGAVHQFTNASGSWVGSVVATGEEANSYSDVNIGANGAVNVGFSIHGDDHLELLSDSDTGWAREMIDPTTAINYGLSMEEDSTGALHVAYYDGSADDLMYATNTSGVWSTTRVDTAGNVGYEPSLKIDSLDAVHIAYLDADHDWLKYATNASGSWVVAVADAGPVGSYARLVIASDDTVFIAYESDTSDLRLIDNGAGTWLPIPVTPGGSVASFLRLEIDAADALHIIFGDYTDHRTIYGTDASGSWVWETVLQLSVDGLYAFDEMADLAVAAGGEAHIVYCREDSDSGDCSGVFYLTNESGVWVDTVIDAAWMAGDDLETDISPDGSMLQVVYSSEAALWTAAFPVGYTGASR
jgi:hypothetical protein